MVGVYYLMEALGT